MTFNDLKLSAPLLKAVSEAGYETPSPIQASAIPPVLEGRDLMGCAQTGTGKTCAFAAPILQQLSGHKAQGRPIRALILTPTRELAIQITDEIRDLAAFKPGVRTVCLYGGAPIGRQIDTLKKHPQIVVATPGRLSDHMKRRTVRVDTAQTVVLDEADRMLDMGFIHDVTRLLDRMDKRKNLGLFSATISREVMDIAWVYQRDAEEVTVREDEQNKPDIKQFRMDVSFDGKAEAIAKILNETGFDRCMVFCNTKGNTERITKFLQMRGIDAECIHGDIPQRKREQVMEKFRRGELRVFVSTDVAARGIDVDDVDIVFNCDVPDENQDYVHRIGRTGRAGREGRAFSLAVGSEVYKLRDIQRFCKTKIVPQSIPSLNDVTAIKAEKILDEVQEIMNDGELERMTAIIEKRLLAEDYSSLELAAAFLKMSMGDDYEDIAEDVRPLRDLEDLGRRGGSRGRDGRGQRDGRGNYRGGRGGRFDDLDEYEGRRSGRSGMASLFINLGKNQNVKPGDILGAIAGETGIPGRMVGSIDMYDKYTFVEVPKNQAEMVMEAMKQVKIRGKNVRVEIANRK